MDDRPPTATGTSILPPGDAGAATTVPSAKLLLELLPYQRRICEFLKSHDPDVWKWFAASSRQRHQADELKFELLKSTYRIDRASQSGLYSLAQDVAESLGLACPITLYQAQDPLGLNASLAYLPDEIHVVFHGPVAERLSPLELRGLLGHELSHFLLWQGWDGQLRVAAEMLAALVNDRRAHPAHLASLRLMRLYGEIACDRGAFLATRDMLNVVSMLVKVSTGVIEVSPSSYLQQAQEILARSSRGSDGETHPEAFLRARAIQLFAEQGQESDQAIAELIETGAGINELDLLQQAAVADCTRQLFDQMLHRRWFQTTAVLAHARLFFDEYAPPVRTKSTRVESGHGDAGPLAERLRRYGPSVHDYLCFVLLDLVTADRELEDVPLAAALAVAAECGLEERLVELAKKELRLRKNQLEKIQKDRASILAQADQEVA